MLLEYDRLRIDLLLLKLQKRKSSFLSKNLQFSILFTLLNQLERKLLKIWFTRFIIFDDELFIPMHNSIFTQSFWFSHINFLLWKERRSILSFLVWMVLWFISFIFVFFIKNRSDSWYIHFLLFLGLTSWGLTFSKCKSKVGTMIDFKISQLGRACWVINNQRWVFM